MHSDWRAAFVIKIYNGDIAPRFGDDLTTVKGVFVLCAANVFQRSDTVGVVLKSDIKLIVVGKADKLAALPCKIVTTDLDGITYRIVVYGCAAQVGTAP